MQGTVQPLSVLPQNGEETHEEGKTRCKENFKATAT